MQKKKKKNAVNSKKIAVKCFKNKKNSAKNKKNFFFGSRNLLKSIFSEFEKNKKIKN